MIEQNTKMVIFARIKLFGSHYVSLPNKPVSYNES